MDIHASHSRPAPGPARPSASRWAIAALMMAVIGLFYWLREHWAHALGLAPYLLLLACPLMHLLHGHGAHGQSGGLSSSREEEQR